MKLEGKVALVTGAAHGQGASHCRFLAREGAQIIAIDICKNVPPFYTLGSEEEMQRTVADCKDLGVGALGLVADVRSLPAMREAVNLGLKEFGQIDILVNNAGIARIDAIDDVTTDVLDAIIDINVKGSFYATQCVVPGMKLRSYGRIVNIASAAAVKPLPYLSHYSASKAAMVAATKSWAKELGPWEITVNCIAPGTVLTDMIIGLAHQIGKDPDAAFEEFNRGSAFTGPRAHVLSEDISQAVMYLVSEEARMVTGQVISVDGGKTS